MNDHVAPELLESFVRGDLGERTAVLVARHLDDCPACANLVRQADPLARAFASVDDPELPAGLVAAVLAADAPARPAAPWTELGIAAGLVGLAAALAWEAVGPTGWWRDLTSLARGLSSAGSHATSVPGALPALAAIAALSALGAWTLSRPGSERS